MNDQTNDRKIRHLQIIEQDQRVDRRKSYFDTIHLKHRALPELDLAQVDPSTSFMGKKLSFPLLISSMTGGQNELIDTINKNLALAAEHCGIAMGVGSQRVMFTHPESRKSFELRKYAPTTLLFSNLGAIQLNYGFAVEHIREAIEVVGADGLFLHLNPLQEAIQPEGNTNFSGLAEKIGQLASSLDVPIVLKEVGAGISDEDVKVLVRKGIHCIDVAGTGGTSWSRIEHHRQSDNQDALGLQFQDWGIPTPMALQMLAPYRDKITLIASGGIRSGVDMVKAMVLGASLCGLASPFLQPAMESHEKVINVIERLKQEFTTAMFLLGLQDVNQMRGCDRLVLS
ncbi:MAG: type 2 isopentenyl-diphosphate Delta-isomerase [Kiritimatiellae bacterium]|nr:type 2 isopentenyl-diphosphate Delta-isomerase [Kiritimatiellia bacterium]